MDGEGVLRSVRRPCKACDGRSCGSGSSDTLSPAMFENFIEMDSSLATRAHEQGRPLWFELDVSVVSEYWVWGKGRTVSLYHSMAEGLWVRRSAAESTYKATVQRTSQVWLVCSPPQSKAMVYSNANLKAQLSLGRLKRYMMLVQEYIECPCSNCRLSCYIFPAYKRRVSPSYPAG